MKRIKLIKRYLFKTYALLGLTVLSLPKLKVFNIFCLTDFIVLTNTRNMISLISILFSGNGIL